jgi:SAM-dependent methyltransferase
LVSQKTNYGIDRPDLIEAALSTGGVAVVLAILLHYLLEGINPQFSTFALYGLGVPGLALLTVVVRLLWGSEHGKLRERDQLFQSILLKGNEQVLDVGCGPGLLLVGAASRLKTGRAVGIDIWQGTLESNNSPEAAIRNAAIEGTLDRIDLGIGDARFLPFRSETFDIIVSRAVIHHLPSSSDQKRALHEMSRLLRNGGQLGIIVNDIWRINEYLEMLGDLGYVNVSVLRKGLFSRTLLARWSTKIV